MRTLINMTEINFESLTPILIFDFIINFIIFTYSIFTISLSLLSIINRESRSKIFINLMITILSVFILLINSFNITYITSLYLFVLFVSFSVLLYVNTTFYSFLKIRISKKKRHREHEIKQIILNIDKLSNKKLSIEEYNMYKTMKECLNILSKEKRQNEFIIIKNLNTLIKLKLSNSTSEELNYEIKEYNDKLKLLVDEFNIRKTMIELQYSKELRESIFKDEKQ